MGSDRGMRRGHRRDRPIVPPVSMAAARRPATRLPLGQLRVRRSPEFNEDRLGVSRGSRPHERLIVSPPWTTDGYCGHDGARSVESCVGLAVQSVSTSRTLVGLD